MDSLPHHWLPAIDGTWLHDAWLKAFLPSLRLAVVLAMTPVLYAMPIPGRVRALLVIGLSLLIAAGVFALVWTGHAGYLQ